MSVEKLKQAKDLIQQCIDEYQGEENQEGEGDSSSGDSYDSGSDMPSMGMGGGDKIKMAAALMKQRSK